MSLDHLGTPVRSDVECIVAACLDLADAHAREECDPGAERRTKLNKITRRAEVELESGLSILRRLAAREGSDEHDGHEELIVRAAPNGNRVTWWMIARRTHEGKPVVALDRVTIRSYADLEAQRGLTDRERDAVVRSLGKEGTESVLVLADWLVSKKSLQPLAGTERLFGGEILARSPAAIQFAAGTVEWVPKSQAVVYTLGEGQTLTSPQRGLTEFCTDGGNR